MKRVHIIVKGRVQGVAFRAYTQIEAKSLNLSGYVRNQSDGSVEILAEGKKETLEKLISWAKTGSPMAEVEEAIVNFPDAVEKFNDFEIRY